MTTRTELQKQSTDALRSRLASLDAAETYEREAIIRILNERSPAEPATPNPVKQGLLDAQLDWIDPL